LSNIPITVFEFKVQTFAFVIMLTYCIATIYSIVKKIGLREVLRLIFTGCDEETEERVDDPCSPLHHD